MGTPDSRHDELPQPEAEGTSLRPLPRVLLGDSEAWSIDLFREAAARFGAELHVAKNGVDVLEQFKSLTPSLVVLDTLLPKLDGLQAAAKLREMELGRIRPIVVTSALYRPGEDVERLRRKFGFTDFLPKPFALRDIEQLLDEHLGDEAESPAPDTDLYEDGAPVRLGESVESPLSEMGVPALLCQLYRGRRSGTLMLRRGEITKVVFFERGHITHARSNSRRDRLGRILLRSRKIALEDYERARRLQTEASGRLQIGEALVQLGVLNENDVANAVASQILNVLFSLFDWDEGSWSFLDSSDIPPAYARFNFNTANLIFWGLRQMEGRRSFGQFLPAPRLVLERPADAGRLREQLNLTYLEEQVLSLVDGRKRLAEILSLGRLARIDVERVIFSLLVVGVLRAVTEGNVPATAAAGQVAGPADEAGSAAQDHKGTLLQTSVVRVVSRIHLGGHTGVLGLSSAGKAVEIHFDGGEIVYARSDQPEHRLGSILLRAGTIAEADHDRAVTALAGGDDRRIGTILLEMRAISLEELHTALRLQIQDITLDLFHWQQGDYRFETGAPRTDLVVSLAATTPNLIMEGARGAVPPPGILRMLASPDTLLMKLWGDERLGRLLQLTSAERRLLSYIETGRAARELVSLGLMGENELAQSLHGLLALEVVKSMSGAAVARSAQPAQHLPGSAAAIAAVVDPACDDDTPFPPRKAARPAGEEVTGAFEPQRFVREGGVAALSRLESERDRLAGENVQLRARVTRLEHEIESLKEMFSRYYDLKEGSGVASRVVDKLLDDSRSRGPGSGGGLN